jgi:energy-coupling factor transporter ATP-binding protein EcfA2
VPKSFEVLLPRGQSVVVFGENGTGKSTIADMVEFFLTGGIEFLSKEGRSHAIRHIGAAKVVDTAVEVTATGTLGGRLGLPLPKGWSKPIGEGETFLLRGRTLADFLNKSKGEKWKALSQILGLEAVDELRLNLQTAANNLERDAQSATTELATAADALASRNVRASKTDLLAMIKDLCNQAGVEEPGTLDEALHPDWSARVAPSRRLPAGVAVSALAAQIEVLPVFVPTAPLVENWNLFVKQPISSDEARVRLMAAGKAILDQEAAVVRCPLCGQQVDHAQLRSLIEGSLATLQGAAGDLRAAEESVNRLIQDVRSALETREGLLRQARELGIEFRELPAAPLTDLEGATARRQPINLGSLQAFAEKLSSWREDALNVLKGIRSGEDDGDSPLFKLGVVVELGKKWATAERESIAARNAADLSARIFMKYQDAERDYFAEVLNEISGRAAEIYGKLHPGEGFSSVSVEPMSEKGVELAIDFHGSHEKPPHGVLSESHLNSLAIALFLAMAESFNERIGFLVLDDVVNSFDIGHRGQLADLLATDFKDWQLLVLTHDEQFYRRIIRLAPDWSRLEFTSWTFEEGPRTTLYQTADMLEAARQALADHDRIGAATKGRRAVEEFLQEMCEGLEAPLPFRRGSTNDRREIGELISGLRRRLKETDKASYQQLDPLLTRIEADVQAALNVEAHSSIGRAADQEIQAALDRLGDLIQRWTCTSCGTRAWKQGGPDVYSCRCHSLSYPPPPSS